MIEWLHLSSLLEMHTWSVSNLEHCCKYSFSFNFLKKMYLAMLGLSCSMWDPQSLLCHAGSISLTRDQTPAPALGAWSLSSWTCKHSYTWPDCTAGFIPRIELVGHEKLYLAKQISDVVMPVYMCTSSVSLSTCRTNLSFSFYSFWILCSYITSWF